MRDDMRALLAKLADTHSLDLGEYEQLVEGACAETAAWAAELAMAERRRVYGSAVYVRGLVEVSNYCRNDCRYCGIRRSNAQCRRYRISPDDIAECARIAYEQGIRTFVLQGGEDPWFTDTRLCGIVDALKQAYPDCAITLSMGERSRASYRRLFEAGADRYLLRHETATVAHYAKLHPSEMSFEARMRCLRDLRDIGYAVGVGFMVGSPWQTPAHIAADLKFIEGFRPEMCGIGPFIPHHATPLGAWPAGTVELTCFLLSLIRLMQPNILLPSTTALGTIDPRGREKGMLAGANVLMPNVSPPGAREAYELYDGKERTGIEGLAARMEAIGFKVVVDRGDPRLWANIQRGQSPLNVNT